MAKQVAKRDDNYVPVLIGTGNDSDGFVRRLLLDPDSDRLMVDALTEGVGHDAVGQDTKTVASAGTAVQLQSHACKRVILAAHEANSDLGTGALILIGGAAVVAATATRKGMPLYGGQTSIPLLVSNTNLLYIDSTEDGAKVHYFYET